MAERWVQTPDGASLFVNDLGPPAAPTVVVLHGGPAASHDYLLPAFARLADAFRIVLYDQRGGGRSRAAGDVPLDFDTQVADVETVIRGAGVEKAHLVGYSYGGLISMVFAARHPGRVDRLALCSSAPPGNAYRAPLERALAAAQASPWVRAERQALEASGMRETLPEEYRRRRFSLSVVGYFHDPRLCYGLTPFRMQSRTADIVRDSAAAADLQPEIDGLDGARTLFLHGAEDPIDPAPLRAVAERIGARFETVTGSGHVPYLEAPEPFFSILRGFLGEPT